MTSISGVSTNNIDSNDELGKEFKQLLYDELRVKFGKVLWGVSISYNKNLAKYYLYIDVIPIVEAGKENIDEGEAKELLKYVEDKYGLVNGKVWFSAGLVVAIRFENLDKADLMWMIVVNKLSA